MEDSIVPSLSSGAVGSRFVSQDDIETARERREEQWKAAYARLGQAPPAAPVEDSYDGRSLAEKLAANRIAKQEEWEEKTKLANQYRALEEDEVLFLDSLREREEEEERQRKQEDGEEVRNFKEAVAARTTASNQPTVNPAKPPAPAKPVTAPPVKKEAKRNLKGVIVKKKPKAAAKPSEQATSTAAPAKDTSIKDKRAKPDDEDDTPAKRRKT